MSGFEDNGTRPSDPLGFMQRLSPSVTYYEPSASSITPSNSSSNAQADPELVLLSTWMGARESHIVKYVQQYRVLFPTSRILVAQCPFTHVVMPFLAWTQIRPAVPILKDVIEPESKKLAGDDTSSIVSKATKTDRPRILIHAFSNGGISTTLFLYNALKRSLGGTLTLPPHIFIFDSCPGTFRWRNTARAIMQVLPRWTSPAVHAVLFSVWLFYRVMPVLQPRQNVNSRTIRNPRFQTFELRRTYLYGTADQMIPPADVEHEAGLAAEAGFQVRLERFDGATHVAIPMSHPDRYWRVVQESWYGEQPPTLTDIVVEREACEKAELKASTGSETVTPEIKIVDNEKPIREEAGILAEDLKSDAAETMKTLESKAQEVASTAQHTLQNAAIKTEDIKESTKSATNEAVKDAQAKTQGTKDDVYAAIEQGDAQVQQITGGTKGMLKEIEIKGNRKSLGHDVDSAVQSVEEGASCVAAELVKSAEQATKSVKDSLQNTEKKAPEAVEDVISAPPNEGTWLKKKAPERHVTPEASTALKAALAAASPPSANKSAAPAAGTGGVQEIAAKFDGKVDKSRIQVPKAKASQGEITKSAEDGGKAKEANKTPAADSAVPATSQAKVEQPKTQTGKTDKPKSKKSKKSRQ